MDEETKKLIQENLELSKKNNEILHKLYKFQRFNQMIRVAYWVIIILVAVGAFYFVQPFLDQLSGFYGLDSSDIMNMLK